MRKTITTIIVLSAGIYSLFAQPDIDAPSQKTPNDEFVYRLPWERGVSGLATSLSSVEARHYNAGNLVGFKCHRFSFGRKVDVYAARKGTVAKVDEGYVAVIHNDGTIAAYDLIESICVDVGDMVYPDTKIASTSIADGKNVFEFELYYVTDNPNPRAKSAQSIILRRYIDPVFKSGCKTKRLKSDREYRASAPKKMIDKEK